MKRKMVMAEVAHGDGMLERITTDDPRLLGEWLIYTAHAMPEREKTLRGNWNISAWEQGAQ
jgi:hypothetical protein